MFSSGQMKFALFFLVLFIILIALAYRKDWKKNKTYFKGAYKILIGIAIIITIYIIFTRLIN